MEAEPIDKRAGCIRACECIIHSHHVRTYYYMQAQISCANLHITHTSCEHIPTPHAWIQNIHTQMSYPGSTHEHTNHAYIPAIPHAHTQHMNTPLKHTHHKCIPTYYTYCKRTCVKKLPNKFFLILSLFLFNPGVYTGLYQAHAQTQSKHLDSRKKQLPRTLRAQPLWTAPHAWAHSPAPRNTLGQRSTCAQARHLYFLLPLIKPHNKTAHQGARHYCVIKVNMSQVLLNRDALEVFICTESLRPANGKNDCGQSSRR